MTYIKKNVKRMASRNRILRRAIFYMEREERHFGRSSMDDSLDENEVGKL